MLSALVLALTLVRHGTSPVADFACHSYTSPCRMSWYTWFPVCQASLVDTCCRAMSWRMRESLTSRCSHVMSDLRWQLHNRLALINWTILKVYMSRRRMAFCVYQNVHFFITSKINTLNVTKFKYFCTSLDKTPHTENHDVLLLHRFPSKFTIDLNFEHQQVNMTINVSDLSTIPFLL